MTLRRLVLVTLLLAACGDVAADDESFDSEDGGDGNSSSGARGQAGRGHNDEGDDIGALGERPDAGSPAGDAGDEPDDEEQPEPRVDSGKPREPMAGAGGTAGTGNAGSSAGSGGAGGSGGAQAPACAIDADADGVCDEDDVCPNASDADNDQNGFADACDLVLWSDQVSMDKSFTQCAIGSELESWLEVHNSLNGQTRTARLPVPLQAGSSTVSIPFDSNTETKAMTAALEGNADLSTKVHARVEPEGVAAVFTSNKPGDVSIKGRVVTRYVFKGSFSESCDENDSYSMRGSVTWEIRGY